MENNQRGVSLIITFFIMTIILAVILGISVILISEVKIIRNIGNSVVAFYAADSGIEKTLYLDKKEIPINGKRGFCNICTACPDNNANCKGCILSGDDCSVETCRSCQVSFKSFLGDKLYEITAKVEPAEGNFTNFDIYSRGSYKDSIRAISLEITRRQEFPDINNPSVILKELEDSIELEISANIKDPNGVNPASVMAHIQDINGFDVDVTSLVLQSDDKYLGSFSGPKGTYYVKISACDLLGNCITTSNI